VAAPLGLTASIGLTAIAADDTADAMFARADRALYRAKDLGRDRVHTA
jgi:PleD family two-component response regulator